MMLKRTLAFLLVAGCLLPSSVAFAEEPELSDAPAPPAELVLAYKNTHGAVKDSLELVLYKSEDDGQTAAVRLDPRLKPRVTLVVRF